MARGGEGEVPSFSGFVCRLYLLIEFVSFDRIFWSNHKLVLQVISFDSITSWYFKSYPLIISFDPILIRSILRSYLLIWSQISSSSHILQSNYKLELQVTRPWKILVLLCHLKLVLQVTVSFVAFSQTE